ncbi:hypothetical protein [Phenylobacterium deserti]|uniref:hypothetical protein n=1 Tax=Phenylobacterium deserti TaxID=1914756 RepID=UPI001402789D|nr:hypothetical protein [Phenylobacterium deserti]
MRQLLWQPSALRPLGWGWAAACARSRAKVGRDADGKAGGCDNFLITLQGGAVSVAYVRTHD